MRASKAGATSKQLRTAGFVTPAQAETAAADAPTVPHLALSFATAEARSSAPAGQQAATPEELLTVLVALCDGYLDDVPLSAVRSFTQGLHHVLAAAPAPPVAPSLDSDTLLSAALKCDPTRPRPVDTAVWTAVHMLASGFAKEFCRGNRPSTA